MRIQILKMINDVAPNLLNLYNRYGIFLPAVQLVPYRRYCTVHIMTTQVNTVASFLPWFLLEVPTRPTWLSHRIPEQVQKSGYKFSIQQEPLPVGRQVPVPYSNNIFCYKISLFNTFHSPDSCFVQRNVFGIQPLETKMFDKFFSQISYLVCAERYTGGSGTEVHRTLPAEIGKVGTVRYHRYRQLYRRQVPEPTYIHTYR